MDEEARSKTQGDKKDNMMIPSRRKLGAAALIIAGIGAFLVPFLLHSPSTQGTSSNNGGTNPNNGSHTTTPSPTTPTTPTPTTPSSNTGNKDDGGSDKGGNGGTTDNSEGSTDTTGTCTTTNTSHGDTSHQNDQSGTNNNANQSSANDNINDLNISHNANDNSNSENSDNSKGNQGHAYGLLKHQLYTTVALLKGTGTQNVAFLSRHDTKTDNNTVHTQQANSESTNNNESSCAETADISDD